MTPRAPREHQPSLRARLLLLAVVPVVIATAVLGTVAYGRAASALTAQAIRSVGLVAHAREQGLVRAIGRQHDRAQALLRAAVAHCENDACLRRALGAFVETEGALGAVIETPGRSLIWAGPNPPTPGAALPPGQLAFVEPGDGDRRRYVVEAKDDGGRLLLRFYTARVSGIFRDRTGLGESGETFLVARDGHVLTEQRYPSESSHPVDARPINDCLAGREGETLARDYRGVEVVHGYRYVDELGGVCIMAHLDRDEAFAGAKSLRTTFAIAAFTLGAAAAILAWFVARATLAPIERLAARARTFATGDLRSPVPVEGPHEIAEFGRTLAAMAGSLERSTAGLSFLLDASRVLSERIDDIEVALTRITDVATRTMATYCVVDLLDGEELRRAALAHRDPEKRATLMRMKDLAPRLDVEGPWTRALHTGKVIRVETFDETERRKIARSPEHLEVMRELDARSIMMIPLRSGGRTLGVLTLASTERAYDDADVALGEEFANRAGTALENARLYREAREAAWARERFLSIASHELRTPLTALNLHVEGVQRMRPEERMRTRMESIAKQVRRMNDLVEELLDVSRIASGRMQLEVESVDLHELVRDVAQRLAPELNRFGSTLGIRDEGGAHGEWDRLRLEQIVTNLLSNAAKYGEGKPIEVTVGERGGSVFLRVRDQGIGIAEEDQARIFDRFERAVSERNYGGFGLGLWITRQLVRALGGEIGVHSVHGEGSTFTVELPKRVSIAA